MTADPGDYGLTAEDLRDVADRLYPPNDARYVPVDWTLAEQARFGQIRSRLRATADALEDHQGPAIHIADRRNS